MVKKKQIPLPRLRDRNDRRGTFIAIRGPKARVTQDDMVGRFGL